MGLIPINRPMLSMLFSPTCPVCEKVKPKFAALAQQLAGQVDCQLVNIDAVQVAVPVTLIPGFHLAMRKKCYYTDPQEMYEKWKLEADEAGLAEWIKKCAADHASLS